MNQPSSNVPEALPVAPSMAMSLRASETAPRSEGDAPTRRIAYLCGITLVIGIIAAFVAMLLGACIVVITNLAFYGTWSLVPHGPADNQLGLWVIGVPIVGALIVGAMARYGSEAIRGHGIPEAMEQVLFNESKIPARVLFLKPLSAVVAIGTGGPFGAEGPIIATGGALGSLFGQFINVSAAERKTLLAAGAAAGMAATFGTPVAAVLLAIELLLFEYRVRSFVPVVCASFAATVVRVALRGTAPAFVVPTLAPATSLSLIAYVAVGAVAGVAAVLITKAVYGVEDAFERIPIHWMWWPALGAIPVGIMGVLSPHTLGVGYDNIENAVSGSLAGEALLILCVCKLISWLFSLGSGTSGGTLAPLFTIGGGVGVGTAMVISSVFPNLPMDTGIAALVGMAALFAAASRAPLTSVMFAFEATQQPAVVLPLMGGCGVAYFLSYVLMKNSIMTEKIARRGRVIPSEYSADHLEHVLVCDVGLRDVVVIPSEQRIKEAQRWVVSQQKIDQHSAFPVVDVDGKVIGVLTGREILAAENLDAPLVSLVTQEPIIIRPSMSLREAADLMAHLNVGRLPVLEDAKLVGIITRSDLVGAHRSRLRANRHRSRVRNWKTKVPAS